MADRNSEVQPPLSRVFVVCSKSHTEQDIREAFSEYGRVEDVWILKDKQTRENKGIAYVKFNRASSAAIAVEKLDGTTLGGDPKVLKVIIASSKNGTQNYDVSSDDSRNRLFVVLPRDSTEQDLYDTFSQFDGYETVHLVRDRTSGELKGFGFVKFNKPSQAALAMESCDSCYKAVIAEPKEARAKKIDDVGQGMAFSGHTSLVNPPLPGYGSVQGQAYSTPLLGNSPALNPALLSGSSASAGSRLATHTPQGNGLPTPQRLYVVVATSMTQDQFTKLFDIAPGLIHSELKRNHTSGTSRGFGFVTYATPAQAQYAREKITNLEYPPGNRIIVKPAEDPPSMKQASSSVSLPGSSFSSHIASPSMSPAGRTSSNVAAQVLSYTTSPSGDMSRPLGSLGSPPPFTQGVPKPDDVCDSRDNLLEPEIEARLFIVCTPVPPPDSALRSVFGHFGSLIDVYMVRGHNYGYARYSSRESADLAKQHLHGADVAGSRLKVIYAEPPPQRSDEPSRKRPRT